MPRLVMKPQYFTQLLGLAVPLSAYAFGCMLQAEHDKGFTKFRNKSQMYGGRKQSVW